MKLTRLHFSAATLAALTTLSLFGCGGGGTPSDNPTPETGIDQALLLRTWRTLSLSKGKTSVICPGTVDGATCTGQDVTFSADGAVVTSGGSRNTWTLSGNQLSQTTDRPGEVIKSTISLLTDNELRLVYSDGATITFSRVLSR